MSEDCRVGILLRGSSVRVCLVVVNQGCCSSGQYNLPDRMLRLDANTTLNQSYVLFITLFNTAYKSGDQYIPSIHSWDSSPWQALYIPLFFLTVCLVALVFFKCVINLSSFLFKSKFISFPICDSAHLLSHYYYCYNYYFYYYLLLIYIFFYMFCFAIISHFHCLVMPRYF